MALPGPGPSLSVDEIATEFGGTTPHSLTEYYRSGGLVPNTPTNAAIPTSGQIAVGDFYGASNRPQIALTISSDTYNYDVYTQATPSPAYIAGSSDITVTVNPGVTVGSTATPTYAMLVPSAFNAGDTVTIINNGVIQGKGGNGGNGGGSPIPPFGAAVVGSTGANAIYVNRPTVITNNGTVASGGGGGGGGGGRVQPVTVPRPPKNGGPYTVVYFYGGGGGGGGAGYNGGTKGLGGSGASGSGSPGSDGSSSTGGAGGPSGGGLGGSGGGRGAAGAAGTPSSYAGAAGGATGNYIVGNPFVTWPVTGTRQGGVA